MSSEAQSITYLSGTYEYKRDAQVLGRKETEEEGFGGYGELYASYYTKVCEILSNEEIQN